MFQPVQHQHQQDQNYNNIDLPDLIHFEKSFDDINANINMHMKWKKKPSRRGRPIANRPMLFSC